MTRRQMPLLACLTLGLAYLVAAAQGWQVTTAWGFGREYRSTVSDKAPGVEERVKLGFFGLRRSFPLPRWPHDFAPQRHGAVRPP